MTVFPQMCSQLIHHQQHLNRRFKKIKLSSLKKPSDSVVTNKNRTPNTRFILPKPVEERNVTICEKIATHTRREVSQIIPPVIQQPVIQQSVMQQSVMQQSVLQQSVMQQSVMQQSVMQQPVMQQPVMQQPVIQQSVMQSSVIQQPVIQPPVCEDNQLQTLPPHSESAIMAANSHIMVTSGGCEKQISFLPEGQFLAIQSPMPVFLKGNDWMEQNQRIINQVNLPVNTINYGNFKRILPKPISCEMVEVTGYQRDLMPEDPPPPPPPQPRRKPINISPSAKNYLKILRPRHKGRVDGTKLISNMTETTQEFTKILLQSKDMIDNYVNEGTSVQNTNLETLSESQHNEPDHLVVPQKLIHVVPDSEENNESDEQFILPDMPESRHMSSSDQTTTNVVEIDDEEEADDETVDETYEDFEESEEKFGINNEVKGPSTSGFKKIVLPSAGNKVKTTEESTQDEKFSLSMESNAHCAEEKKVMMIPSTSTQASKFDESNQTKKEPNSGEVTPNSSRPSL
ncbi:uncharacterized protein isoform X2 [Rhodnius prolixus]|uniref:uncharacterized protein isoform X2 n=1 Tax=Rhodnius prolixus TaxID=13249 RepID=UPI003D18C0D7